MSKRLTVKVKTSTLITALRKALADREQRFADNDKREREYEQAHSKWQEEVAKTIISLIKNGKAKVTETDTRCYGISKGKKGYTLGVEVPTSISFPEEPKRNDRYNEWEFRSDCEALTNAIRVLEMTEDEFVSTSTYHSVVKFL